MPQLLQPTAFNLQRCVERLHNGGVVALPTETVYGLACLATDQDAVKKVFHLKQRPLFNPLIVHTDRLETVEAWVEQTPQILQCATRFWPGPLTLICRLKASHPLSPQVTAGRSTVGLRVPSHPLMQTILKNLNQPLAAPSANRSGRLSCTRAQDVCDAFQGEDLWVLDGGPCLIGVESTIVDTTSSPWSVLRWGGVTLEALKNTLGDDQITVDIHTHSAAATHPSVVRSPGQLLQHYAPSLPVRLNVTHPLPHEAFLGFGPMPPHICTLNLSPSGCLEEAASHLFSFLHQVDRSDLYLSIAVAPIPHHGLGHALNDRLSRAAAGRSDSPSYS